MICKDIDTTAADNRKAQAGIRQEQDVAFFLKRAFADKTDIRVFNDLKFNHNGETAQIDHLILYPYGFVLIESKSITGHVKVNKEGEWQRSYQGKWNGMRSPIKQVELQQQLLRRLLFEHREEILPKILMGKLQQSFSKRSWDNLCAISSNAIIERDEMPKDISKLVVKSEFIADKVIEIMNIPSLVIKAFSTRPAFNEEEMLSIEHFLLTNHQGQSAAVEVTNECNLLNDQANTLDNETIESEPALSEQTKSVSDVSEIEATSEHIALEHAPYQPHQVNETAEITVKKSEVQNDKLLSCKKCGEHSQLTATYGKYGYYVICDICETNTTMRIPCPTCGNKKPKITKRRDSYTLNCGECDTSVLIFQQAQAYNSELS